MVLLSSVYLGSFVHLFIIILNKGLKRFHLRLSFKKIISLSIILLINVICIAQNSKLVGVVIDNKGEVLPGALIQLGELYRSVSDEEGKYSIKNIVPGNYIITISYLGFLTDSQEINIKNNQKNKLDVKLKENVQVLNSFTIQKNSIAEATREKGYSVDVIETKKQKNLSSDLNQIIKSTPGINIRENGGLGSGFKLSLNGLSGNQIRYFIDGVPMENFGTSLTLNNFPINAIERIEIYKGVVPISLSSDALGGAINIISGHQKGSFIDASYMYGSFNTHRLSINGQYSNNKKGYYVKLLSFFNHSDNDYLMNQVPVFDLDLGNRLENIDIKRFNDEYTSGMLLVETGIFDKKYIDKLSLKITKAQNRNNYQHTNNNILRPLGVFFTENNTTLISGTYKKQFKRLGIRAYALSGLIKDNIADTSRYRFNWAGDKVLRSNDDPKGELLERRSFLVLDDQIVRSQLHLSYILDSTQSIDLSLSQNYLKRIGEDKVDELNLSFNSPSNIQKNIIGLSYKFQNKKNNLSFNLFGKEYLYSGIIVTKDLEDNEVITKPSLTNTGYGIAISYKPINAITLKTSFERAYRLPESYEILGDGIYVNPNPSLEPEKSNNFNLGVRSNEHIKRFYFQQELKYFYRFSENFIRFNALGPFGEYENLNNVLTQGIEASLIFKYSNLIEFQVNATYQNLTDQTEFDEGLINSNYKSKLPNIPYFFGNTRLGISPFKKNTPSSLTIYWNMTYVKDFFLIWENSGNPGDKNIIPTQIIHGFDVEYSIKDGKYNISMSVTNAQNALAYDNFNIQKPGRAFYIKLRYSLSKK